MRFILHKIADPDQYKKSIIIMRHAEKNIAKGFKDGSDQLLTKNGQKQSVDMAAYIKEIGFRIDQIFSSPMERCLEAAQCITDTFDHDCKVIMR